MTQPSSSCSKVSRPRARSSRITSTPSRPVPVRSNAAAHKSETARRLLVCAHGSKARRALGGLVRQAVSRAQALGRVDAAAQVDRGRHALSHFQHLRDLAEQGDLLNGHDVDAVLLVAEAVAHDL